MKEEPAHHFKERIEWVSDVQDDLRRESSIMSS